MRPCWAHIALMNVRPIYVGNASSVESILVLHLRIGLGLVLGKGFVFGLNSCQNK